MPEERTLQRAAEDKAEGKSASTQAGEFVREEMHHIREGKHGAQSPKQAIAIGLSKARRAGVKLPPPKTGKTSARTRRQAQRDLKKGQRGEGRKSRARSRGASRARRREGKSSASHASLSRHAREAARKRGANSRRQSAKKAARTRQAARR